MFIPSEIIISLGISRQKYIEVTKGTERVYQLAKKLGVKLVFGTDTLFDPELAEKQGKQFETLSLVYPC
ncbi:hypothetical protein [Litorilituus sediminis]|uniref:hypothetical protein n=1 Tax=Litorilituus sediminis TaxID=718192 RepID=UPI001FEC7122|nr:hypothetical protein [Litorilituus sediminis]